MKRSWLASPFCLTLVVIVGLGGCRDESREPSAASRVLPPGRGDHVLVEQTAAVFFEGRVLAAEAGNLRIQTADRDGSVTVAAADVYRLAEPNGKRDLGKKPALPAPGQFAICRSGPQRWQACKIERANGDRVSAVGARGERIDVTTDGVLTPSPVTELNLRRHFERTRERLEFAEGRARAGEPKAPAEFRPLLRERVLARAEGGWYTAYVREIGDEGVRVAWQSDRGISTISEDAIVPEPPYTVEIRRGDFVLVRPLTPALPWQPVQVRSVGQGELRTVDVEGHQRSVSAREVVPLRPI